MADPTPTNDIAGAEADTLSRSLDRLTLRTHDLTLGANRFAQAMTGAFTASLTSGRQFDDVLKSLALRLSDLSVKTALKPVTSALAGGLESLFGGSLGNVTAHAKGGVVGTPTYFPLPGRGLGLAGEAGPEAILPLARGPDGSLGVAAGRGGAPVNIAVTIATPDAASFRRSEAYLAGQIARAVARGQRSL